MERRPCLGDLFADDVATLSGNSELRAMGHEADAPDLQNEEVRQFPCGAFRLQCRLLVHYGSTLQDVSLHICRAAGKVCRIRLVRKLLGCVGSTPVMGQQPSFTPASLQNDARTPAEAKRTLQARCQLPHFLSLLRLHSAWRAASFTKDCTMAEPGGPRLNSSFQSFSYMLRR